MAAKSFVCKMRALTGVMFTMSMMFTPMQFTMAVGQNFITSGEQAVPPSTKSPKPVKALGKPDSMLKKRYIVVLDAGHGSDSPGAASVNDRKEKDFTLSLTWKVAHLLDKVDEINVVMTRKDNSALSLSERVSIANDVNANVFLSIHGNSLPYEKENRSSVSGTETYYHHDYSRPFADTIHECLVAGTQFKDLGVHKADFVVLKDTKMPSALAEVGYLSSLHDEPLLFDEQFQWRVAVNLAKGILEYLGVSFNFKK